MTDKKKILVVDDSPNEIRILMEILKTQYAVVVATSGEQALALIAENRPDLVLLDVSMQPMNGYETCVKIKEMTEGLPVIFVSASTETDEILKGFDAGGRDYVAKPIDPQVMLEKVRATMRQLDKRQQLTTQHQQASEMAMAAMTSASDLSVILNFLRLGTKLCTAEALAEAMVTACREYQLTTVALVVGIDSKPVTYSGEEDIRPLETEVLRRTLDFQGRIFEHGARMIIHFESVALLVKNQPEDQARRGELRDYLMILCENAHDLNLKIQKDSSVAEQRMAMLLEAVQQTQTALEDIQAFQRRYKEQSLELLDELMAEILHKFTELDLTENQEQQISQTVQAKLNMAIEQTESGVIVDEQLKNHVDKLGTLTQRLSAF